MDWMEYMINDKDEWEKNKRHGRTRDVVDGSSCQNQRVAKCPSFAPLDFFI